MVFVFHSLGGSCPFLPTYIHTRTRAVPRRGNYLLLLAVPQRGKKGHSTASHVRVCTRALTCSYLQCPKGAKRGTARQSTCVYTCPYLLLLAVPQRGKKGHSTAKYVCDAPSCPFLPLHLHFRAVPRRGKKGQEGVRCKVLPILVAKLPAVLCRAVPRRGK